MTIEDNQWHVKGSIISASFAHFSCEINPYLEKCSIKPLADDADDMLEERQILIAFKVKIFKDNTLFGELKVKTLEQAFDFVQKCKSYADENPLDTFTNLLKTTYK